MNCTEFLEGFSEYVDGLLPQGEMTAFEVHRTSCPDCARYTQVYAEGQLLLRAFSSVDTDMDFESRLENRIHHLRNDMAVARTMGSGGSTTAVLSIAAVLLIVAWSPLLFIRPLEFQMAPITVSKPGPRPLGIRLPAVRVMPTTSSNSAPNLDRDLWQTPNELLYEYSPVLERYRTAGLVRTGTD